MSNTLASDLQQFSLAFIQSSYIYQLSLPRKINLHAPQLPTPRNPK